MRIGFPQGRTAHPPDTQMIAARLVAGDPGLDIAQAYRPGKLGVDHRHKLGFRGEPTLLPIGAMLLSQPFELAPRQMLHQLMKNRILMSHGIDPPLVSGSSPDVLDPVESMPCALYRQKTCRTVVGQVRP